MRFLEDAQGYKVDIYFIEVRESFFMREEFENRFYFFMVFSFYCSIFYGFEIGSNKQEGFIFYKSKFRSIY